MPDVIQAHEISTDNVLPASDQKRRRVKKAVVVAAIFFALLLIGIWALQHTRQAFEEVVTIDAIPKTSPPGENTTDPSVSDGIGRAVPDFTLAATDGATVRLEDLRGKSLVLAMYASWNTASLEAVRLVSASRPSLEKAGIAAFAVANLETIEQVRFFAERGAYAARILADEDGALGEALRLTTLPAFFFIDAEGILKERYIGLLTQEELVAKAFSLIKP